MHQILGLQRAAVGQVVQYDGRAHAAVGEVANPEECDLEHDGTAYEMRSSDLGLKSRVAARLKLIEQRGESGQPRVEQAGVAADDGRGRQAERHLRRSIELRDALLCVQDDHARRDRLQDLVVLRFRG
jgi:hypothetical protein